MTGARKLLRELTSSPKRVAAVIFALAIGLIGFNAVAGAYGVLYREIQANYARTVPASATLEFDDVSEKMLSVARADPQVGAAIRRKTLHARFRRTPEDNWRPALVFVVDDFSELPIAKFFPQQGASVPPPGTVLLERSAQEILGGGLGTEFDLKLPTSPPRAMSVSGVVHEAALAPAKTHQTIYAYVSVDTARLLGDPGTFDELRILTAQNPDNLAHIEQTARTLAASLGGSAAAQLHGIRVPKPLHHPHQTQMVTILTMLVIFGALLVWMSSLLAASLISTLMARQVREIGVMKALGARSRGVLGWYLLAAESLAVVAALLAWFPGRWAAHAWVDAIAQLLNFDIESYDAPGWIVATQIVVALAVPALTALPSILRGSRVSVRTALNDFGSLVPKYGGSRIERMIASLAGSRIALAYALRNVTRQRRRALLAIALLSVSGATFISAISVASAWDALTQRLYDSSHYSAEIVLAGEQNAENSAQIVRARADVDQVEIWRAAPTALTTGGQTPISRSYPDDAHGSFFLVAPPDDGNMLDVEVTAGSWLSGAAPGAVVINQMVPGHDALPIGAPVELSLKGKVRRFVLAGKIRQVGMGATAYVSGATFDALKLRDDQETRLLTRLTASAKQEEAASLSSITDALDQMGAGVSTTTPLAVFQNAMVAHFEILVNVLLALALLALLVGTLGLSSSTTIGIIERTRELAVLRAIGAKAGQVRSSILLEGVIVGVLSFVGSLALGLLLSLTIGSAVGQMSFRFLLPLTPSWGAVGAWLVGTVLIALGASWFPANRASKLRVKDALAAT